MKEDIIKYEGVNSALVTKHITEDFGCGMQLLVHDSQEAVLICDGMMTEVYGAGLHTVEADIYAHSEIYFVNKVDVMNLRWGTDTKSQYVDPVYNVPVEVGACGEMTLRVDSPKKLLGRIVGTEALFESEKLADLFRAVVTTKVKSYIPKAAKAWSLSIYNIDENLELFSCELKKLLSDDLGEYGIELVSFFMTGAVKDKL